MDVLIVNGWSQFNRGDLAIALGTARLWSSHPGVRALRVRGMDGSELDLAGLEALARDGSVWEPDALDENPTWSRWRGDVRTATEWVRGSRDEPAERYAITIAMGGHYLKAVSGPIRAELRMQRLLAPLKDACRRDSAIVFWGHSVGPFANARVARELVALANTSVMFACREPLSAKLIRRLGVWPSKVQLVADPALLLEAPSGERVASALGRLGLRPGGYVAVTVRQPEARAGATARFERYVDVLARFVRERAATTPVVLVAQSSGPTIEEDDRRAIRAVLRAAGSHDSVLALPADLSLDDLTAVYGGARYTIATRLHSAILGFVSGTPAVGVSYSGLKTRGVFARLGLDRFVCDYEGVDAAWLMRAADEIDAGRDALRASIRERVAGERAASESLRDAVIDYRSRGELAV